MKAQLCEWNQLAGGLGFEPRLTESESAVLPLNYPPIRSAHQGFRPRKREPCRVLIAAVVKRPRKRQQRGGAARATSTASEAACKSAARWAGNGPIVQQWRALAFGSPRNISAGWAVLRPDETLSKLRAQTGQRGVLDSSLFAALMRNWRRRLARRRTFRCFVAAVMARCDGARYYGAK